MSLPKPPGFLLLCLAALLVAPGSAQSTAQAAAKPASNSAPVWPWPMREIHFSGGKPVLGLPAGDVVSHAHCSNDGINFLDLYPDSATALPGPSMPELYSVSSTAIVKHLVRKVPVDYTDLSVRDFFVADHTLVTLLHAERRDDRDTTVPPRDVRYFLSTSDYDGDSASLVSLDVKFKPLKVALFGSGDFLVLGWDESNLLPLLALVKDDGTIRRFVDLDHKPTEPYKARSSIKEVESAPETRPDLATLQRAAFVPYNGQVMLTYPGTARGIRVLSSLGGDGMIPIALPGGFVLHDVLPAGDRRTLVLRAEEKRTSPPAGKDESASKPMLRMFEMDALYGTLLREFYFDKPAVADVTCSPANKLTTIFYDTVANVVQSAAANGTKPAQSTENATQLVIVTAPR
jgi:hypothetical protein